ncbi:MAG TPA: YciI family protein [Candidatus Dormibacteraeota bacterium]|nr:YciI family protein [Candidatus Dormibacteraeota bacterium]
MKFAMVIVEAEDERREMTQAEAEFNTLVRWWADLHSRVNVVASGKLAPKGTARTVSWRDQVPIVTDGPFVEAKESVAGILIVDLGTEAEALELAKSWPAKAGFKIEVRALRSSVSE